MIWTMTIATFLATLVGFALIFLLYSRRNRIRQAFRKAGQLNHEKRTSRRRAERVRLELSSLDKALIREVTFTENVSHHGVRVVTKNRWEPYENVQVKFLPEGALSCARITYCNPLGDEFATGLQFSVAIGPWLVPHKHQS